MSPGELALFIAVSCVPAAFLAYGLCWLARQHAARFGLVDRPGGHKSHLRAVPLGGGLAIAASVLLLFGGGLLLLYLSGQSPAVMKLVPAFAQEHLAGIWSQAAKLWILLGGATILALIGWWDDVRGLDWRLRLGVQIAVACACVLLIPNLRLTAFIAFPGWTIPLSVFWLVALINAFNMLDNMDGLSAGVAVLCGGFLAAILLFGPNPDATGPQLFVAGLVMVVTGASAGFLGHNSPPAKLFMGDAGSYFIGFLFAAATILASYTSYDQSRPYEVLAPLFIMAVPLYDMVSVICVRVANGKSPFAGDRNHFSHRLVELGFSRPRAVQLIYLVTIISGLEAFLLHRVDSIGAAILCLLLVCQFVLVALLESTARRTMRR